MPRIILGGFSKQKYSGNLPYQFVDTEQKYQINPQLLLRPAGLLYPSLHNKSPITPTIGLATFDDALILRIK
jgi:hypothetical protein